jgi:hypothetical protein
MDNFCFWLMKFQKNNENIKNLIHCEYIEGPFLFNKRFMQRPKFFVTQWMEQIQQGND